MASADTRRGAVRILVFTIALVVFGGGSAWAAPPYPWLETYDPAQALSRRIEPPPGFVREALPVDSFGAWLRGLPLKQGRPPVHLYDGREKGNQQAHFAVIDIDVGSRDLQQCADAVMRLRGEFLYASQRWKTIHFNFTSGDTASFESWANGNRPRVEGNRVRWIQSSTPSRSHTTFRQYMDTVFTYAGTLSLAQEMKSVKDIMDIRAGDVFIQGGSPGHAVLVVDVAVNPKTQEKRFLLAQSYMPAQEIHVLENALDRRSSPWYDAAFPGRLYTPEWTFERDTLKRWVDAF